MANFIINRFSQGQDAVTADSFTEEGSFVVFYDASQQAVAAYRISNVSTIHREKDK